MAFILGTAGHVDHGKTSFVQILSGLHCDTLEEEQRRGITIELGFVQSILPNGVPISIIDVPGHEKFIKNMVAGVTGIHAVAFIISAEEGIMPQTQEHLEILSLLGVRKGLIILTKIDIVDAEWLALITEQVRAFFKDTVFVTAPLIPFSSLTQEGVSDVLFAIEKLEKEHSSSLCQERLNNGEGMPFRLPLDRVFTIQGHGTVVTGSALSGVVVPQQLLQVYPSQKNTKAKSIQQHHEGKEQHLAGTRIAINLHNINTFEVARGDCIAEPNSLILSNQWEVELSCLSSSPVPIKHRGQIHFHHNTKEVLARIHCLHKENIEPGETALCHVYFEEEMVAVALDRCIIRSCSPLRTIAGCIVLNPIQKKSSRVHKKNATEELCSILCSLGTTRQNLEDIILTRLDLVGEEGLSLLEISLLLNVGQKKLEGILQGMVERKRIVYIKGKNPLYISATVFLKHIELCAIFIAEAQYNSPLKKGITFAALCSSYTSTLPSSFLEKILDALLESGKIEKKGEYLCDSRQKFALNPLQEVLRVKLLAIYKNSKLTPPYTKVVQEQCACSEKELLTLLIYLREEGELVRIEEDLWYASEYITVIQNRLHKYFEQHTELTLQDFKGLLENISRKYLVALLEYFDSIKYTLRVDTYRVLRK